MATTGLSSSAEIPETRSETEGLDLVIGLPARGSGVVADGVIGAVRASLEPHGAALRWRLIVAHPAAGEAGRETAREGSSDLIEVPYAEQPSDSLNVAYHGLAGRARATHAIFAEARARNARACVIIDPRAPVSMAGIENLVQPLLRDAVDVVAPMYHRHPYSGAIVHGVVYPLFRAIYGARLRYPIGADIGCSARFLESVLPDPIWDTDAAQIGIDVWMSATAVLGGFRVGQAQLGDRLEERAGLDLPTIVAQVLGFCFSDMERRAALWQRIRGSRELPVFGGTRPVPPAPDVDVAALAESFRLASRELQDVWTQVLPPLAVLQWRRLSAAPLDGFRVDDALWARTIYDFAMGHRLRVITRDHLLRSLTPLYLAWLVSFVRDTANLPPPEAEARIERLCHTFESEKPYLVSQWRWPERFKPVKQRR